MDKKMKIIIGAISGVIIVLGISLFMLVGRGIDMQTAFHVYEDDNSIYYYLEDPNNSSYGDNMELLRFDLETKEFEVVHEDKNIDTGAYSHTSKYNSPLVYSKTYRDFFNITTGEFTDIEYFEICSTSEVSLCYAITDDIVIVRYVVDSNYGFLLYQISTDKIILDRVDTPFDEEHDETFVGNYHYFPTDNKFLYNVSAQDRIWLTENTYETELVLDEFYLVDLTTGVEEKLSDEIYNKIKYTYTLASDDYLYVYNTDAKKVEQYDSNMKLIHSNDYSFLTKSERLQNEYGRIAPLLCDKNGIYEFDDESDKVKLVHSYIDEPTKNNLVGFLFEISPNHVIYKVETMFLKANYFVVYDLNTDEELYRGTSVNF